MEPSLAEDRFSLREQLGQGSSSIVYRAHDALLGRDVALKIARTFDLDAVETIKREFRVRRGIAHPNLVQLYELFVHPDQIFLSMELVVGRNLATYVRGDLAEGSALDDERAERLKQATSQLAGALAALHDDHCTHGDLKPGNVLVDAAGRAVLVDFGLAERADRRSSAWAGTLAYMAPELLQLSRPSPLTDWYALGACLAECLAGRPPYEGSNTQIARQKLLGQRPALPQEPTALCALARELMQTNPEHRAGAVAAQLDASFRTRARGQGQEQRLGRGAEGPGQSEGTELIGRDAALAALARGRRAAREGERAHVIVVEGESGMGKTALAHAYLDAAQAAGALTLFGTCHPREYVSFKALDGCFEELAGHLASLEAIDEEQLLAAGAIFPAFLRCLSAAVKPSQASADAKRRERAAHAIAQLLAAWGDGPQAVTLWIDDAHWGDRDSALMLYELLQAAPRPELLIVLSRQSELPTGAFLDTLGELGVEVAERVSLAPLSSADAERVARGAAGSAIDARTLAGVVDAARGSPFLLSVLARRSAAGNAGPVPQDVNDALDAWLRDAGGEVASAAAVVAVCGRNLTSAELAEVGATPEFVTTLFGLQERRLLQPSGRMHGGLEFTHHRLRQHALAGLAPEQRANVHRSAAQLLERRPQPDHRLLLEHWEGAGNRERAGECAVCAAREAVAGSAFSLGAELLERALRLRARGDEDWRLEVERAEALAASGQGRAAGQSYLKAAEAARSRMADGAHAAPSEQTDCSRLTAAAARELLCAGEAEEGVRVLRSALAQASLSYPERSSTALLGVLGLRARRKLLGFAPRLRDQSFYAAPRARLEASWAATIGLNSFDSLRSAHFQAVHTDLALRSADALSLTRAHGTEAMFQAAEGGERALSRARRQLARARRAAARGGDAYAHAFAQLSLGVTNYWALRWPAADRALVRAAERFSTLPGVRWEANNCRQWRISAAFWAGRLQDLATLTRESATVGAVDGDSNARYAADCWQGSLRWLMADEPDALRQRCAQAMTPYRSAGFQSPDYAELVALARCDLYEGDGVAAWRRVEAAWPHIARAGLLRLRLFCLEAELLRATAALSALPHLPRVRERRGALKHARRAIAVLGADRDDGVRRLSAYLANHLSALQSRPGMTGTSAPGDGLSQARSSPVRVFEAARAVHAGEAGLAEALFPERVARALLPA